jgi:hypothetical protein
LGSISSLEHLAADPKMHEMAAFFGALYAKKTFGVNAAGDAVGHIFKIKNVDKAYQFFTRTKELLTVSSFNSIPLE